MGGPMSARDRLETRTEPDRFVGRSSELTSLETDLRAVPHPRGPVRVLCGVAGVGKTRLAEELTRRARTRGVTVAWGHCPDALTAPPYWPWTQVVRSLLGRDRGTDLATMVLQDHDAVDRFELFDATAAVLRSAAQDRPLLIVLDDLHAADHATLQLTRFLARQLRDVAVLMVVTVRTGADTETDSDLGDHLVALDRLGCSLEITGLAVEAVGELLNHHDHVDVVHAVTGGNPLHVHQIVRALSGLDGSTAQESSIDVNETLRRTVSRRILEVTGDARLVLEAAAVLGTDFDRRELAAMVDPMDPGGVAAALDHLAVGGFLDAESCQFSHSLVAEVVKAELKPADLHRLHHRAAEVIGSDDDRSGEAAHHLLRAGPEHRRQAVLLSRRAGALATAVAAHEDAVVHLTLACEALDTPPVDSGSGPDPVDGTLRLDVLMDLGAALWRDGRTVEADRIYEKAWTQAVALGDPESLARAVLRNGVEYYFSDKARPGIAARVEQALASQGPDPSPTKARLLADLATHHLGTTMDTGRELAEQAVAMALQFDDPVALGSTLIARQVTDLGPATLARRTADSHEILACARDSGDYRLAVHGRFLLMVALLEAGDIGGLDGELLRYDAVLDDLGEPRYDRFAQWLRATRAMLDGDVATAENLAAKTFEISGQLGDPDAFGVYGGQIGVCLWMQGRVIETEPVYAEMRAAEPHETLWPSVLAWLAATHGQAEAARGALAAVPDPATIRSGMHWLLNATTYAEVAASVGTDEQVEAAWNALVPYADHVVPVAMGAAVWGTVAKPLGHLALRRGDIEEGISYLRTAVRTCARLGARPWMIDAQLDLADALAEHRPHDPEVEALRGEASAAAHRLGLALFIDRIAATDPARSTTPEPVPDSGSTADAGGAILDGTSAPMPDVSLATNRPKVRVIGAFEVVDPTGRPARWTSRKARELLKILVSRRGAPISRETLMDLLWPGDDPGILANRLSVALSTVRRALDPGRTLPAGDLVSTTFDSVALNLDVVDVDVEHLLVGARAVLGRQPIEGEGPSVPSDLAARAAALLDRHRGEALPDEPHADWATSIRSEVRVAMIALARMVADDAGGVGDHLRAVEAHRRILDLDPYDEAAHVGVIAAFRAMGAHGQAETAQTTYARLMADLGLPLAGSRAG